MSLEIAPRKKCLRTRRSKEIITPLPAAASHSDRRQPFSSRLSRDMLDLEPHDLTRPQSAAITETEQNARLEARGHRQQPLDLICAHHQRKLLRLTNVIDLFGQVQSA